MPEDPSFSIFVERLKDGTEEKIEAIFSPDFLGVDEEALKLNHPVKVEGRAYLASDTLIVELNWTTTAILPCSICNQPVNVTLKCERLVIDAELSEIKSARFSFAEALREAILLETPHFVECEGGCPARKEVEKYLAGPKDEEERYHPFENL